MATRDIAAEGGSPVRNALLGIPAAYRSTVGLARRKPLGAVGGAIALIFILVAIASRLAILPVPDPYASVGDIFLGPSREYPMGTDVIGRDILARVLYGTWISLYVGIGSVLIGITAGFVLGITSTYAGGFVDLAFQRVVDALMSIPGLILALAIMAVLGSSLNNVILAIVIGMLAPVIRHRALPGADAERDGLRDRRESHRRETEPHRFPAHHAQLLRHLHHHGDLLSWVRHHY